MEYGLWINGQWQAGSGTVDVENPATGKTVAQVATAGEREVNAAVAAAKAAFDDGRWSKATPGERSGVLWKMADIIEARADELAKIETEDTGKPYEFISKGGDLPFVVDNLRFFATAARDTGGSSAGEYNSAYTSMLRREPCGVSAGIAPWNYPLLMAAWKIGPALAAGCTSIIKPSEMTPRTTLLLGEIAQEAGLPDGVLNIITGAADTGKALVAHPDIQMVSLTGSSDTGKFIMRSAADSLKRVHLELGGKAPLIVFADADIERAAEKAAFGGFINSGHDCTAATRILVHESVKEKFTEALLAQAQAFKVGQPFDEGVMMGPLISAKQLERVAGFVERAKAAGAKALFGGHTLDFGGGHFYSPTLLTGVDQKAEIVQNEVFGPVMSIQTFKTDEEALAMANDTCYGLHGSIFTESLTKAHAFASELKAGTVSVNCFSEGDNTTPFGGYKLSGFGGKDKGRESHDQYTEQKTIFINLDR